MKKVYFVARSNLNGHSSFSWSGRQKNILNIEKAIRVLNVCIGKIKVKESTRTNNVEAGLYSGPYCKKSD